MTDVLTDPALKRLWDASRDRLERNGLEPRGVAVIEDPTDEERQAVAGLLGLRRSVPGSLRVSLPRLDRELRASRLGIGILEVARLTGGPLVDQRARRAALRAERNSLWEAARAHPLVRSQDALGAWLEDLRASGVARRLGRTTDGERELLTAALAVLERLPATEWPVRLNVLSSELFGDAHALDHARPVGAVVLRALAHQAGRPAPCTALERRTLWAWSGVTCDELSTDVLALNLTARGRGYVAEWLCAFSERGEPVRVTLRQLSERFVIEPETVFVCENPALVAEAADRLSAECPPLVCVEGMPTTAAIKLLERAGRIKYHGDFDWGGIRAANAVFTRLPAEPWRFTAAHYVEAVSAAEPTVPLRGVPADAAWDDGLRSQMAIHGVAVYEEQLLATLLGDLSEPLGLSI